MFTLERADGSAATTVSGFRVVGAKRIRDHDEVNCRRLSEGRHACTLGLIRASTGTGAFRIRRHRKFVVEGKMRVHNGFGHIPGVSRLPAGTYVLDLLTPGRTKHVFASIRFELR